MDDVDSGGWMRTKNLSYCENAKNKIVGAGRGGGVGGRMGGCGFEP